MKKQFAMVIGGIAASLLASASYADFLAEWTFETSVPATAGDHVAEGGLFAGISLASGNHASGATVYSNPVGNGSLESFSSNNWGVGDYYQFTTSTVGFMNITISWDQTRSSTGPQFFDLYYSTDGTNFTLLVDNYDVPAISWSSTMPDATGTTSFAEAGPAALDNQATIWFRMVADSAASGTAGSNRVDNVVIAGTAIPAPGALALLGIAGLGARRRRRNA